MEYLKVLDYLEQELRAGNLARVHIVFNKGLLIQSKSLNIIDAMYDMAVNYQQLCGFYMGLVCTKLGGVDFILLDFQYKIYYIISTT